MRVNLRHSSIAENQGQINIFFHFLTEWSPKLYDQCLDSKSFSIEKINHWFFRSSFSYLVHTFILWVTKNKKVSLANNLNLGTNLRGKFQFNIGTNSTNTFLIAIHNMQSLTATTGHGGTRKRTTKRLKHTGNLFSKNLQLIGVC